MSVTKVQLVGNVATGATFSGIVTATGFVGDGSGLTGVANTGYIVSAAVTSQTLNVTSSAVIRDLTVNGTQTIVNTTTLEVADINVGIASTSSKLSNASLDGAGITIYGSEGDKTLTWDNSNSRMSFSDNLYAPSYYGDGSQLTGVVSGIELQEAGSSVGTSLTAINFASGATLTTGSAGISTITIAAAGIELQQAGSSVGTAITAINFASNATLTTGSAGISTITISAGIVTAATSGGAITLDLSSAQDHKITATGITTITVSGGNEGESHTVRIINSGSATVGFSPYFLFPSGATPSLPTASGAISLVSFTVNRVGAAGTQLLAGASLNFS